MFSSIQKLFCSFSSFISLKLHRKRLLSFMHMYEFYSTASIFGLGASVVLQSSNFIGIFAFPGLSGMVQEKNGKYAIKYRNIRIECTRFRQSTNLSCQFPCLLLNHCTSSELTTNNVYAPQITPPFITAFCILGRKSMYGSH